MKKITLIILFFLAILGSFLFFRNDISNLYLKLSLKPSGAEKGISDFLLQEIEKQILTPEPLRAQKEDPQSFLSQEGVVQWTNDQRTRYGFLILKESTKLDESARLKLEDMFEKQYFAHNSPSGIGVGDLAKEVGYEFIAIGENLALGNFENDEALVQAWMDSPGHRENILNTSYREIGVAVGKATFEGKTTWIAIQHFGLPINICPQPSQELELEIKSNEDQIKELQAALLTLKIEIQSTRPKWGMEYNQKVVEYNSLVAQYNGLVDGTKNLVNEYNYQVKIFNECLEKIR